MRIKSAFRLAEVLITLAIIGVVATVTLPALNANVTKKSLETATLKAYNSLQNAAQRCLTDNEVTSFDDMNFSPENFVNRYFNVVETCMNANECFEATYDTVGESGNTYSINELVDVGQRAYKLNDGATIQIRELNGVRWAVIDVNGEKNPNTVNRDMWVLSLMDNGAIRDAGGSYNPSRQKVEQDFQRCLENGDIYGCFGHFLSNGFKFDY